MAIIDHIQNSQFKILTKHENTKNLPTYFRMNCCNSNDDSISVAFFSHMIYKIFSQTYPMTNFIYNGYFLVFKESGKGQLKKHQWKFDS
jgi:hypothetical protein